MTKLNHTSASTDKAQEFLTYWRMCAPRNVPEPEAEYNFDHHLGRKHRFDWAWLYKKVAVEVEGNAWGVAGGGRHMTDKDLEKYNLATSLGWRLFRFSPGMLKRDPARCVEMVVKALKVVPNVSDGFGLSAPAVCPKCGGKMQVIRPGDIRCSECEA